MTIQKAAPSARRARFLTATFPPFSRPLLQIVTAASLAGLSPAAAAPVLPTGGSVASGTATVGAPSNGSLTVTQSSDRAIVNWTSFSIGSGGTVNFNNGNGATLNRVTGTAQSSLAGNLNATGSVYLINQNGVIVNSTGVVKVGGNFVASTLGTSDAQFNAGGSLTLSGNSTQAVINAGKIGSLGGDVALVATQTTNSGTITAPNGSAGVLAGTQVTLARRRAQRRQIQRRRRQHEHQRNEQRHDPGGEAELKANGGNVYALAGNTNAVIAATGVTSQDGKVFLDAGDTGTTTVSATISAKTATGAGGTVETSGGTVNFTGIHVTAGEWIVDPVDLKVGSNAAATISTNLATTNVQLQTRANGAGGPGTVVNPGNGDIIINAAIGWNSANKLTLSAFRNIDINANISSTGGGQVTLKSDNTATGTGTVSFSNGAQVSTSGKVGIFYDPSSYTSPTDYSSDVTGGAQLSAPMLVNNINQLQAISTNSSGSYALNANIDASVTASWNGGLGFIPIGATSNTSATPFTGLFKGAVYTISNLTIDNPAQDDAGLFAVIGPSAQVGNFTLTNVAITGHDNVGTLAGISNGAVSIMSVSGTVAGIGNVGGLIGSMSGTLSQPATLSDANVSTAVNDSGSSDGGFGGLVGSVSNNSSVSNSSADGPVTGGANSYAIGGLVGTNFGSLNQDSAYATLDAGNGASDIGGLVGGNYGAITDGYTNSAVDLTSTSIGAIGGLLDSTTAPSCRRPPTATSRPQRPRARRSVVSSARTALSGTITSSSTTGNVTGVYSVGGLVGWNLGSVTSSNAGGASGACGCSGPSGTVTGFYRVGGLVGWNQGSITATNSGDDVAAPDAFSSQGSAAGGLVGVNDVGAAITQSDATGDVSGDAQIGGFVGYNGGSITEGQASGNVTATGNETGGLVGYQAKTGTITFGFGAGSVQGASYVGGLLGYNDGGTVTSSAATGGVTGNEAVGGLVGINTTNMTGGTFVGTITTSWATGAVGGGDAGGLVGENAGSLTESWAGGAVTGAGNGAGGLVGTNDAAGTIQYAYALGSVSTAAGSIGGLIGGNSGTVSDVYATGAVTNGGGLIGYAAAGSLTNAYWDTATTGQASAIGAASGTDIETNINPVSAASGTAYTQASYSNFDFTGGSAHWFMVDGQTRPFLTSEAWSIGTNQYIVTNAHQLQLIALNLGASYELIGSNATLDASATEASATTASSDMWTSAGFVPVGSVSTPFTGTFNGQGGVIDNLYIDLPATHGTGMFVVIGPTATVENLSLNNVSITGPYTVGGLAAGNEGLITNVSLDGTVAGTGDDSSATIVGGLVGINAGTISDSNSSAAVAGDNGVGGLVGANDFTGTVNQGGAFISPSTGTITGSFATGNVSGTNEVGGLVGQNFANVIGSYATGVVSTVTIGATLGDVLTTGVGLGAGGLAGINELAATITASYATGMVLAGYKAGGLAGINAGTIQTSYASGAVSDTQSIAGGLIGTNDNGTVSDVYALGSVTGGVGGPASLPSIAGGVIGYSTGGSVSYAYASGAVTASVGATADLGGIVGFDTAVSAPGLSSAATTFNHVYWDEGSAGLTSAGVGFAGTSTGIGGTTGLDPFSSATYTNLNDGKWAFVDGARPMLQMEYSTTITNAHQLQLVALHPGASYTVAPAGDGIDLGATAPGGGDVWSDEGFVPIANFTGSFEGNGNLISGLSEDRSGTPYQGLFAQVRTGGTVDDVVLFGGTVTGGNDTGALAGQNAGQIQNVAVIDVDVTGGTRVGGVVGTNLTGGVIGGFGTSFDNVFLSGLDGGVGAEATVSGDQYVGGVVGLNQGSASNSISDSDVTGTTYAIGGFAGVNDVHGTLSDDTGDVAVGGSGSDMGGLVGANSGQISGAGIRGTVGDHTTGSIVGGLVGRNYGEIDTSEAQADVIGQNQSGGLAGWNTGTITNASATGNVTGSSKAGGAIGENDGAVSDVEAFGDVSGTQYVGGFVGQNDAASITGSSAEGTVTGTTYAVGGFAGGNYATGGSLVGDSASGNVGGAASDMGGFAGVNDGEMSADSATGTVGDVTTQNIVGGLVGRNYGTISLSSTSSVVEGLAETGGLVGWNTGTVSTSDATGSVTGTTKVGGLVGENDFDDHECLRHRRRRRHDLCGRTCGLEFRDRLPTPIRPAP